ERLGGLWGGEAAGAEVCAPFRAYNTPTQRGATMRLPELFAHHRPTVSFEFFPPRTDEAAGELFQTISDHFRPLRPSFVSVTYGAASSTLERTSDLVIRLQRETEITTVPDLTCVGASRKEIASVLQVYADAGVENILPLRGYAPRDAAEFKPAPDGFRYAAELVEFIRREFPNFGIGVAGYPEGHPETPSKLDDLDHLKRKVDAGADAIITQLFFDNRDFYDFVERCRLVGIGVPIVAGI